MRKLLEELFACYYQDVYRYLYSLSRDASLSEDLAAETFLEVVKSVATFRAESDIRTWLFTIARRRWIRFLEKQGKTVEPEELLVLAVTPEEQYFRKETAERILQILDTEPERTRKTVLMRSEGYSFREIGVILGISENSARVIDFRAKTKIKETLKKEGFVDE